MFWDYCQGVIDVNMRNEDRADGGEVQAKGLEVREVRVHVVQAPRVHEFRIGFRGVL